MPSAVVGLLRVLLTANTAEFKTQMDAASQEAKKFEKAFKDIGKSATTVGDTLTTSLSLPLLALGASLVAIGNSFDDALDTIRAGTGKTGEALEGLSASFRTVLATVPDDMQTVAEAITEVSRRTGATGESLETLTTQLLNLARLGKADVGELAASTTRLFGDWSIATDKQSTALDYLFRTSQQTGIGIDRLSGLVVQFGAPMRALGFSFEQTAALMGRFEKEGVNLETTMSGLKFALGEFAKAGKDPVQALESVIYTVKTAKTELAATQVAIDVFGKRAGPDMARAIIEGRFEIDALVNTLKNSPETINGAAEATKGLGERFAELKNKTALALEPLGTALITALDDAVTASDPLIKNLGDLAKAFNELPDSTKATVAGLGAFAFAIGPVTWAVGQVVTGISTLIGWLTKLGPWLVQLIGWPRLIVTGLVALTAETIRVADATGTWYQRLLTILTPIGGLVGTARALVGVFRDLQAAPLPTAPTANLTPTRPPRFTPPSADAAQALMDAQGTGGTPPKRWALDADEAAKAQKRWNEEVAKMAAVFKGTTAIEDARKLTAAFTLAGGSAGLTTDEVLRLNDQITDLIAKLERAGPAAQPMIDALRQIKTVTQDVSDTQIRTQAIAQANTTAQIEASKTLATQVERDQQRISQAALRAMTDRVTIQQRGEAELRKFADDALARQIDNSVKGSRQWESLQRESLNRQQADIREYYTNLRAELDKTSPYFEQNWQAYVDIEQAALDDAEARWQAYIQRTTASLPTFKNAFKNVFESIPDVLRVGLTSGWGAAMAELGKVLGNELGKAIGNTISKIGNSKDSNWAAVGGQVGSVIGLGIGLAIDAWQNREGPKVKAARDKFLLQYGASGTGIGSGFQRLAAELTSKLGPALGPTLFQRLLRADSIKEYNEAIEAITWALKNYDDQLAKTAKTQEELNGLQGELTELQASLTPTWEELEGLAKKYGIEVGNLGKGFAQLKANAQFTDIINDWEEMVRGGGDMGGMLVGMQDEIQALVTDSLKMGTTIPENMRPLIDELVRTGRLLDANGEKMTDTSEIAWGPKVETQAEIVGKAIEALITKIEELIKQLADDMAKGAKDGTDGISDTIRRYKPPPINVPVDFEFPDDAEFRGGVPRGPAESPRNESRARFGGLVLGSTVQKFATGGVAGGGAFSALGPGPDTVPALLTPGEWVLNAMQQRAMVTALLNGVQAMSSLAAQMTAFGEGQGGGAGDTTIVVVQGGGQVEDVTARVLAVLPQTTRRNEYAFRTKMREALGVT
jgi:TP901 family phage tail tape measure protein